jgi:hypothetical protein
VAKCPVSAISTVSPGESVLTIAARARGRIDHDGLPRLEHGLAALENLLAELGEFEAAMVDDRHVHGAQHAIRDRARAGNMQEMTTLLRCHGVPPWARPVSAGALSVAVFAFIFQDCNRRPEFTIR